MKKRRERRVNITVVLRGTEDEIEGIKARFAALSACEEVRSLYMKDVAKVAGIWELNKEEKK